MPNILKIGYTMKDPSIRAQELNSTGVPYPYEVDYEILVDNSYDVEQKVHTSLNNFKENKEWFRVDIGKAIDTIRSCCTGKIYYERCIKQENEEKYYRYMEQKKENEERELLDKIAKQEKEEREKQELLRIKKEEDEIKAYIKEKEKYITRGLLAILTPLSLLITVAIGEDFSVFISIFIFIIPPIILLLSVLTKKRNAHLWKEEYLKEKYSHQSIATKTTSSSSYAKKILPYTIITCSICKKQIRIPSGKEFVGICPHCKTRFSYPHAAAKLIQ